jgi:RHS repeat-associated protein
MPSQTSYYHYDGQGSTLCLTNENGDVTDQYAYTAYGEEVDTGVANFTRNPFRYVGQQGYYRDADTGEYYVRARTYSPVLARWLSLDPTGLQGGGENLYAYVTGRPVTNVDSSGLRGFFGSVLLFEDRKTVLCDGYSADVTMKCPTVCHVALCTLAWTFPSQEVDIHVWAACKLGDLFGPGTDAARAAVSLAMSAVYHTKALAPPCNQGCQFEPTTATELGLEKLDIKHLKKR